MLNELTLLNRGVEKIVGRTYTRKHKSISEPGKNNLVQVVLSEDSRIIELDIVRGDRNQNYWTRGSGNHNQFPAAKIGFPLRPSGVDALRIWKEESPKPSCDALAEFLAQLRLEHPVDLDGHTCWPTYRKNITKLETLYSFLEGDSLIINTLVKSYLEFGRSGLSLLEKFDEFLWKRCQKTHDVEMYNLAALAMFGGGFPVEHGKLQSKNRITLLLDTPEDKTCSAAHCDWVPEISKLLFDKEEKSGIPYLGDCAISGLQNTALVSDTFPRAKCPGLGNVFLFSRKKETHTFARYGKTGAKSYPLSSDLADRFSSSLEHLTEKGKQGSTWDFLPSENNGGNDLLVAFCRNAMDTRPASLLSYEDSTDELFGESDYEQKAKQICESFNGKDIDLTPAFMVDFLILRKISDGVQKAIFCSSQLVSRLNKSVESWSSACGNTPPLKLKLFRKSDKTSVLRSPGTISPKEFALLFRKNYTRTIDKKQKPVPGSAFADVIAIFLDDDRAPELAGILLQKFMKQFINLLEQVAVNKTNQKKTESTQIKHHVETLRAVSAISLLLHKRNHRKEVYMKDLAYRLGQFCAVLDEIHSGYCVSERSGQKPPRLIGNQAFAVAVDNPCKALEITAQRIAVYKAWALKNSQKKDNTFRMEEEKGAKYAYFWLQNNCDDIYRMLTHNSPIKATPESRAELLLGYLAGRPFGKKRSTTETPESETPESETLETEGDTS